MSKSDKNKQPETAHIVVPEATLGTNNLAQPARSTLIGKKITLNQKQESFFGVGPVWLNSENYTAEIPEGLTDEELQIISKSLRDGIIVEGNHYIAPIDRSEEVLAEYWNAVREAGFDGSNRGKAARQKFANLLKRGTDRGWTIYEISSFCLNKESEGRARKEVLRLLKEVTDNHPGPKTLFTAPSK